jgi:hypothetical protein
MYLHNAKATLLNLKTDVKILIPNSQIEFETRATGSRAKDAVVDIHETTEQDGNWSTSSSSSLADEMTAKAEVNLGPYKFAPGVGDNWEKCLGAVEKYDNDMCTSWKEEIDTLLVFVRTSSALFSPFDTFCRLVYSRPS